VERLLSIKELSESIGLSIATLYTLAERRQIPVQRVRRRVMFSPSQVERWLARQARPARNDLPDTRQRRRRVPAKRSTLGTTT
jgi:excisionase family DNA binding protein